MTRRWLLAVVAAPLMMIGAPRVARAGCPGGGGGTGGGGTGGGGGHSGSELPLDAYTTPPARGEPACADTSDVVGYRHCRSFAAWATNPSVPPIVIEAGVIVRRFSSLLDGQTGSVSHGDESFAYRAAAISRRRSIDTAVLSTMRADVGLPHGLFTALEVDLGGLTRAGAATTEMMSAGALGAPALDQQGGLVVDSLIAVGIRGASRLGGLGVELAGGVRAVSYSFDSHYIACEQATSITAIAAIAEARVRGELWLSPWLTAGATVGASVIEQRAWMGGLYVGIHTRAFGAER